MTSRVVIIAGFVLLFVAGGILLALSRTRPERFAKFTEALAHVTTPVQVRLFVLAVWAWLGWHFLAR